MAGPAEPTMGPFGPSEMGSVAVLEPAAVGVQAVDVEQAASKKLGVTGWLAAGWMTFVVAIALLAPWLPLDDPGRIYPGLKRGAKLAGPGTAGHLLGSDASGHDLLARTVFGSPRVADPRRHVRAARPPRRRRPRAHRRLLPRQDRPGAHDGVRCHARHPPDRARPRARCRLRSLRRRQPGLRHPAARRADLLPRRGVGTHPRPHHPSQHRSAGRSASSCWPRRRWARRTRASSSERSCPTSPRPCSRSRCSVWPS